MALRTEFASASAAVATNSEKPKGFPSGISASVRLRFVGAPLKTVGATSFWVVPEDE